MWSLAGGLARQNWGRATHPSNMPMLCHKGTASGTSEHRARGRPFLAARSEGLWASQRGSERHYWMSNFVHAKGEWVRYSGRVDSAES